MYSSSEDSNSDSGTFKRGKRKIKEESPVKPILLRQKEESKRVEKSDRRDRFDSKPEKRDDARKEKTTRRSPDRSDKHSQSQSSSYNAQHSRPRSTRSRSRDRYSKNRHGHKSDRNNSPRKDAPKITSGDLTEKYQDPKRTHVGTSRSSKEKYRDARKPSPDEKHYKEYKSDYVHRRSSQKEERISSTARHASRSSSQDRAAAYGPALPPPKTKRVDSSEYAPAMPSNLKRRSSSPKHSYKSKDSRSKSPKYDGPKNESRNYGPSLPKDFNLPMEPVEYDDHSDFMLSDDDSAVIGPIPASAEMSERDLELEKRKIEIKLQQLDRRMEAVNSTDAKHREEWMLELPEIRKVPDLGLSARQFRKNDRPDFSDRSSWTKTPNDSHKKVSHPEKDRRSAERERNRELERRRDEAQEKMAKEHKKAHKRDKTLLEIHEKIKKKEVRAESKCYLLQPNFSLISS